MAHDLLRCDACGSTGPLVASLEWHTDRHSAAQHYCRVCASIVVVFLHDLKGSAMPTYSIPIDPDDDIDVAAHHVTCRCFECVDLEDAIDELRFTAYHDERAS